MLGCLLLATLLLEVFVLTYLEYLSWKTIYTPLCCLMLPYTVVLLITIAVAGRFGFVDFYYPSIFVWNVGLILFAIPSYLMGMLVKKSPTLFEAKIEEGSYPWSLGVLSIIISIAFFYRFMTVLSSTTELFGTDDFAEEFSGHGIWAHLREVVMPLVIIATYYITKKVVVMDYYGLALECPVSIYGEGSGNHCHRVRNVYASLCTQDAPISQPSCKSFFRRFCHIYHHLHGATPYRQREWRGKYGVV